MPSVAPVDRAALAQVFRDPRTLLAFESLLNNAAVPGAMFTTGDLKSFAGTAAPTGWLDCDGSAVSRSAFADLFNVIGTTWGAGDGLTTFNVPDLRGRALVGFDGANPVGSTGGAASITLSVAQLPAHGHVVTDPGHAHTVTDPGHSHTESTAGGAVQSGGGATGGGGAGVTGAATTGVTVDTASTGITISNTGSGDPIDVQSPYAAVRYLIKT